MNLKTETLTVAMALLCALNAFAQLPEPKKGKTFEIKALTVTLIYEGSGLRSEKDDTYEFTIEKLNLLFDPQPRQTQRKRSR